MNRRDLRAERGDPAQAVWANGCSNGGRKGLARFFTMPTGVELENSGHWRLCLKTLKLATTLAPGRISGKSTLHSRDTLWTAVK